MSNTATSIALTDAYRIQTSFFTHYIEHTFADGRKAEQWTVKEEVGRGGFGIVRLEEERGGTARAVKMIYKPGVPRGLDYRRELLAMAALDKFNSVFVRFNGWFEDSIHLYISMEYLNHGDLGEYIKQQPADIPEAHAQSVSKQILEGLQIMHSEGFVHRDLKPQNIFILSTSPLKIKIGDFGITKRVREHDTTHLRTQVYTLSYAAPEVVDMNPEQPSYTNAVDMWSLGCVIYEVLTKSPPFLTSTLYYRYCDGRSEFPEGPLDRRGVGNLGKEFLKNLVQVDPSLRMSASAAKDHLWHPKDPPIQVSPVNDGWLLEILKRRGYFHNPEKVIKDMLNPYQASMNRFMIHEAEVQNKVSYWSRRLNPTTEPLAMKNSKGIIWHIACRDFGLEWLAELSVKLEGGGNYSREPGWVWFCEDFITYGGPMALLELLAEINLFYDLFRPTGDYKLVDSTLLHQYTHHILVCIHHLVYDLGFNFHTGGQDINWAEALRPLERLLFRAESRTMATRSLWGILRAYTLDQNMIELLFSCSNNEPWDSTVVSPKLEFQRWLVYCGGTISKFVGRYGAKGLDGDSEFAEYVNISLQLLLAIAKQFVRQPSSIFSEAITTSQVVENIKKLNGCKNAEFYVNCSLLKDWGKLEIDLGAGAEDKIPRFMS